MNSEKDQNGFIYRLKILIGDEKPYPWAAKVGITQATFNRMWKDGVAPKSDTLLLISEKTGCSIDWLLTGEGEMRLGSATTQPVAAAKPVVADPGEPFAQDAESEELCRLLKRYGNRALVEDVKARLLKIKAVVEE